ncbi:hypothetical protein DICPUDRAFT_151827 [Dictyostelium purpureum]|uniref:Uncharacterized protein n=1 Tax=Dictyostelium purpureum TaxID=5786 RepID=F0ZJV0_DICPU|nr:uncharacterized protein DICPUDRAFT_151827 [Dictyostelium purpureum]EGC35803.1 hypothetical protein DICPUDRAFT_151827 [Dictyostelium purpureum]|eukprot:XP_003287697.1 hypothetical protein DICPUDRAFT_151827 [Dictyostelium purpureum]
MAPATMGITISNTKPFSTRDPLDLSDYYLEGSCTIDKPEKVPITNNSQILRPPYPFYLALDL